MRRSRCITLIIPVLVLILWLMAGCGDEERTTAGGAGTATTGEAAAGAATYTVTFDASWSEQTHPQDFPDDAHFSGLIGAVHNEHVSFWQEGLPASPGIRNMAETGNKDPLGREIDEAVSKGTAFVKLSGDGIDSSPGSVSLTLLVDEEYQFVTLVSMIAPSPDWFVGVDTLSLRDEDGWIDNLVVELYPYDAGTDSGATYEAPDSPTEPAEPITAITGGILADNIAVAPLGTFTFKRVMPS